MRKNELKLGVVLSYVNTGIGMLVSLLYTPVMLRLLGQGQYGVYQTASSVISYLSLLSLGFGSSYMRFFARYNSKNDENGIKKLNGVYLLFYCAVSMVSLIAGFIIAHFSPQIFGDKFSADETELARKLVYILVIGVAVNFLNHVFYVYINAREKFVFLNALNIVSSVCSPLLTLPLLMAGYGAVAFTSVSVFFNIATFVVNIFFALKIGFSVSLKNPDRELFKEILLFSAVVLLSAVAGQINSTIDKYLLARYIGAASVAVYEIGARFNTYLMSFSVTVSYVFVPRINTYVAEGRSNVELTELMTRVGRIQFYVMGLVFGGFVLVGQYFIGIYAGDGYEQSYSIALYLMGASLIPYCQNIGVEIQKAENKHMFRSIAYLIIALCNIAVSIPLIKSMGISGAALGSALALIIGNVIVMNIYYKNGIGLDMNYFWKSMLRPTIAASAAFIPLFLLTRFWYVDGMSRFLTVGCVYAALYACCVWLFGANGYEKGLAREFVSKVVHFKSGESKPKA